MQILKEEVRDRILQAATDDFLDVGFKSSSTRKIVKKAGISNGNLYNYFKSKEELFYAVTNPIYNYFNTFLLQISKHGEIEDFSDEQIEFLSSKIGEMLKKYYKEFIIIMDKSQGTKHENYKMNTNKLLTKHFKKNLKQDSEDKDFVMQILATNFIEALLEICRHFKDENWAVENIRLYLKYHAKGVAQFY